jgi:hypothetical protein
VLKSKVLNEEYTEKKVKHVGKMDEISEENNKKNQVGK